MSEIHNIAVMMDTYRADYNRDMIVQSLADHMAGKGIWTAIPGVYAFKSKSNVIEVQEALSAVSKHFIVFTFDPAKLDGQLENDEWDSWFAGIFKEDIAGMLAFHGEKNLTPEDMLNADRVTD